MSFVLSCADSDYSSSTGECAVPVWVESSGVFGSLSAADGALLGASIVALWCIGAAFRWARKMFVR